MCKEARLATRWEPKNFLRSIDGKHKLIPDVVILNSPAHDGVTVATDITIVHPLSSGYERGVPVAVAANEKIAKYDAACVAQNVRFIPLAWDVYGAMDCRTVEFIQAITKEISERLQIPYSIVKYKWMRIFSCCLQRSNADTIIAQYDQVFQQLSNLPNAAVVKEEYFTDYM